MWRIFTALFMARCALLGSLSGRALREERSALGPIQLSRGSDDPSSAARFAAELSIKAGLWWILSHRWDGHSRHVP